MLYDTTPQQRLLCQGDIWAYNFAYVIIRWCWIYTGLYRHGLVLRLRSRRSKLLHHIGFVLYMVGNVIYFCLSFSKLSLTIVLWPAPTNFINKGRVLLNWICYFWLILSWSVVTPPPACSDPDKLAVFGCSTLPYVKGGCFYLYQRVKFKLSPCMLFPQFCGENKHLWGTQLQAPLLRHPSEIHPTKLVFSVLLATLEVYQFYTKEENLLIPHTHKARHPISCLLQLVDLIYNSIWNLVSFLPWHLCNHLCIFMEK